MLPHPAAAVVKDRMRRLQPDDVARHANNGPGRVIHDVTPNVVASALCLHQGISSMFRKLGFIQCLRRSRRRPNTMAPQIAIQMAKRKIILPIVELGSISNISTSDNLTILGDAAARKSKA